MLSRPSKNPLTFLLNSFFYLLYHQFSWSYDLVASVVSIGLWNQWIAAAYEYLDDQPILELGFGTGQLQKHFLKKGLLIFGIDESSQMTRRTHRRIKKSGLDGHLVRGNSQLLPFKPMSFKRIVATFPSGYIFEVQTLLEIWRVLEENGSAIILPSAWITGKTFFHKMASSLFKITNESPAQERFISGPIMQFKNMLVQIGFSVEVRMVHSKDSEVLIIKASKTS